MKQRNKRRRNKALKAAQPVLPRKENTKGVLLVTGGDMTESMSLANNPQVLSKDILLLRAKRSAKYAKATHLSISELRSISWFAHLPQLEMDALYKIVFDDTNFSPSIFWSVWKNDPETVLRLVKAIRESLPLKSVEESLLNPRLFSPSVPFQKKALQRARKHLKAPAHIAKFAAKLRGQ